MIAGEPAHLVEQIAELAECGVEHLVLEFLSADGRELDDQIILLEGSTTADQLLVKRLKKKKLAVKDRITAIEDQLLPDIIA